MVRDAAGAGLVNIQCGHLRLGDKRMLKRIAIALAMTILVLALIDRASLIVAPCGPGAGAYSNQKGYEDDNCATREGIVVAGVEWLRQQPPDFWTALSSILIAIFTGTLWISTDKLWHSGERQIKTSRQIAAIQARQTRTSNKQAARAADAAEKSTRSAIALQLPIIRVEPSTLGHSEHRAGGETLETCYVHTVTIANVGAQNAFPKEILYGWTLGEKLPDEPSYQYLDRCQLNLILTPKASGFVQSLTGEYVLKVGHWSEISKGNY